MKQTLLCILVLLPLLGVAQLRETFADGNFTQDPAWAGDAASFKVNAQNQLQSNGPAVTGTVLQLSTPSQAAAGVTWAFWANLQLATSSGNYADVYLISNTENLNSAGTSGYFVRLGGTADEVSLFRKDAGKAGTVIINGEDKTLGSNNNVVRVRVTRSAEGAWELQIDTGGTGQNYVSQGTATDVTYLRSAYFGLLLKYSSANSQKFFFDDFFITDTQPPVLDELKTASLQELTLRFNEPLQPEQATKVSNYTLNGSIMPRSAELTEPEVVRLVFGQGFRNGANNLELANLQDMYGNSLGKVDVTFSYQSPAVQPNYNELLITEIMADESPAVGLPEQEYIELFNPTSNALSLQGIRFADATSTAVLPNVQLLPGEYVAVVPTAQVQNFSRFGKAIGISNFPSLNNSGELLQLRQPNGSLIYAVHYLPDWYKDKSKNAGGWSLEMIDVSNPCAGADNWAAAVDARGGTPGQANSVAASNPDHTPPVLVSATATSANQLLLAFSEKLDSAQAATAANYSLSPSVPIQQVQVQSPLFSEVVLQLASPLQESQLYTVSALRIADCSGNLSSAALQATFALPAAPAPGDVVINEVLFNPRPNGVDFVELVNRSNKYLNLQHWQLANTSGDSISNRKTITAANYSLGPGAYVVLTSNSSTVKSNYPQASEPAFLQMSALPAYPDAAGTVVLLQPDGQVADRFSYDEKMHFALLGDVEGVSLERLQLEGPSIASNFHSAATTVFATPGYRNSQSQSKVMAQEMFKVVPAVFSPDNDGNDDVATLGYSTEKVGFVANVTVFDAQGREIRKLARNELLAANGFFQWDGLRDDGTKASIGYYIFYIELFNVNGEKSTAKEKVVLGGRL